MKRADDINFTEPRQKPADDAIKIKCRFCDFKDTCRRRPDKERYENSGWITRCKITPNRPSKKRKTKKRGK